MPTSNLRLDAVVAGYLGIDLAPTFAAGNAVPLGELLRPGKLIEVGPLEATPGGVVANTGLALSVFGARVGLIGLVGKDGLGDLLQGMLRGRGAELYVQQTERAGTAYGIVIAPPGTDRVFLEYPGCNAAFGAADLDYELIARSRLFHFGYPPLMETMFRNGGAELEALFQRVKSLGVATSLDMTLPDPDGPAGRVEWPLLLSGVLPHVDVFVPSVEELLFMLDRQKWSQLLLESPDGDFVDTVPARLYEELADRVLALGAKVVLIKGGHRGAYLATAAEVEVLELSPEWQGRRLWVEAYPVEGSKMQNACGAGDAAVAGFLKALLDNESPETAGRLAMLAGRDSLYGIDTTLGLRSWDEMRGEVV
ncbi:MAG: PfkB family carbohydrate kinase [Armatimonadia bacterium]